MNELGSYIRDESNDSSWSTFVGCQGVAYRALMISSPRCSRGWTNGNRQTSTWSIQQDHTQTAAAMQCCESACTEMHRVVISRIESSLFSVRSASLFTVLSCRLFRCIYTPHSGYQTFVRL